MSNVEEMGLQLAEDNGWFSNINEKESEILSRPVKFRPDFDISMDGEKFIDTEEKFDRLSNATKKNEVLDEGEIKLRTERKERDKKRIRDKIAAKSQPE